MNIFPCCSNRNRRGITLIEVIASLVLMSTLLVGILLSFARHQRQLNLMADRQRANTAINLLLHEWFESDSAFPVGESGPCRDDPQLFWSSARTGSFQFANRLNAKKIRVSVYSNQDTSRPLVTVDLVDRVRDERSDVRRNP